MCEPVRGVFEAALFELLGIGSEVVQYINASGQYDGPDELLKLLLIACSENFWHIAGNYKIELDDLVKAPE